MGYYDATGQWIGNSQQAAGQRAAGAFPQAQPAQQYTAPAQPPQQSAVTTGDQVAYQNAGQSANQLGQTLVAQQSAGVKAGEEAAKAQSDEYAKFLAMINQGQSAPQQASNSQEEEELGGGLGKMIGFLGGG